MENKLWKVNADQMACYNVYRARVEAEDRWIVARIQIVVLSQGFLFAGLAAFSPAIIRSDNIYDLKAALVISVIGFLIGLFGVWGVHDAVAEIGNLEKQYEAAQYRDRLVGLPSLHSHSILHRGGAYRAIAFSYLLGATWLGLLIFILSRL
ncbi:hypothetical protein [Sphingomonas sanxanigenens]|uniref:hypothetical protein n=1 Tax=Sphingomonas sanxanigenens TaxID=397260 RepID=UPI0013013F31|nr:hypothetical protein [Sphingomonas sanxanigenens]